MTQQTQAAFENIVGKGEIAHNEQFLLFPKCFQLSQITVSPFIHIFDIISLFAIEMKEPKIGISGKGLNVPQTMGFVFDRVENIVRKGENAGNKHFIFSQQCI